MMTSQVVLQLGLVGVLLAACAHAQNMTVMCYYFDCPSYSKTAQRSVSIYPRKQPAVSIVSEEFTSTVDQTNSQHLNDILH